MSLTTQAIKAATVSQNPRRQRPISQINVRPQSAIGGGFIGGNYGSLIAGNPRLTQYFGGSLTK